jgi:hypothetical protein
MNSIKEPNANLFVYVDWLTFLLCIYNPFIEFMTWWRGFGFNKFLEEMLKWEKIFVF